MSLYDRILFHIFTNALDISNMLINNNTTCTKKISVETTFCYDKSSNDLILQTDLRHKYKSTIFASHAVLCSRENGSSVHGNVKVN